MYPTLLIMTLFHGNKFKNTPYNLPKNLFYKYYSGAMPRHELVNELFEAWEQVDESQHNLLTLALHIAAGGIPIAHVGTGAGGSSSDLTWSDDDKDKYQRPKSKGRRYDLSTPSMRLSMSRQVGMTGRFRVKILSEDRKSEL